jgi:chorismate-pyruvate lyase
MEESRTLDLMMPLHYFYDRSDAPIPPITFLERSDLPEPQQHLLVHDSDMTPRLRHYHESSIGLTVINAEMTDSYVMRQVVLHRTSDYRPVEYGAIGIQLDGFPPHVREEIRAGREPLGGILESEGIHHTSQPSAWFAIEADAHIANLLATPLGSRLYGRCNQLCHLDGSVFADIVEILPQS